MTIFVSSVGFPPQNPEIPGSAGTCWCCSSPAAELSPSLQMLLTEYLDMKNTRTASEPSAQLSYASSGREFAAFFAKKKPQRPKNPLFK